MSRASKSASGLAKNDDGLNKLMKLQRELKELKEPKDATQRYNVSNELAFNKDRAGKILTATTVLGAFAGCIVFAGAVFSSNASLFIVSIAGVVGCAALDITNSYDHVVSNFIAKCFKRIFSRNSHKKLNKRAMAKRELATLTYNQDLSKYQNEKQDLVNQIEKMLADANEASPSSNFMLNDKYDIVRRESIQEELSSAFSNSRKQLT